MGRHFSPPKNKREEFVIRQRVHLQKKNKKHCPSDEMGPNNEKVHLVLDTHQAASKETLATARRITGSSAIISAKRRRDCTARTNNHQHQWQISMEATLQQKTLPRSHSPGSSYWRVLIWRGFLCVTQTVVWSYTHTNLLRKVLLHTAATEITTTAMDYFFFFASLNTTTEQIKKSPTRLPFGLLCNPSTVVSPTSTNKKKYTDTNTRCFKIKPRH